MSLGTDSRIGKMNDIEVAYSGNSLSHFFVSLHYESDH